jgi:hypothetical protein
MLIVVFAPPIKHLLHNIRRLIAKLTILSRRYNIFENAKASKPVL